ncbi:acyl-CoA dehydrogenase family protein [Comamonas antarctica]|uniref:Acyl-CoA dehydrogenase n=1 Tax=Comamonas antarctica TaxID=2743470 RepID=A0A6N1X9N2_9BURK|nr:acyl-CoA dehydrogenase family protein [Comamonas antarctica]QKV54565.1 acyl-CoA dehydrogenase [Comamonas antarctica]
MTQQDQGLRPEEFGEAAEAAITDALQRPADAHAGVLAAAGLFGVCAPEDAGGMALPLAFAVPVVQAAGRLRLRFALAEQIVLARHLPDVALRAALVDGSRQATIAWQGRLGDAWVGHARQAQQADWLLLRAAQGEGAQLVDLSGAPRELDPALDPEEPAAWLDLSQAPVLAELDADSAAALWHDLDLLFAASAHGAADGALQAAVEHTGTRVQFGAPLSTRQAVRHWLARMKLFHEASGAAIYHALRVDPAEPERAAPARAARSALALNLQHAAFIIEKAMHLHGGMGFTWELPLHRALRSVRALDAACGAGALARQLGQDFINAQEAA